jgi:hypothetical protein
LYFEKILGFNINIIILDIIRPPAFYLKYKVSETGFCLRLQVEPTEFVPIDMSNLVSLPVTARKYNEMQLFQLIKLYI